MTILIKNIVNFIMENQEEIWKVYKDTRIDKIGRRRPYGALYEVSNFGNVRANGKPYNSVMMNKEGYYKSFARTPVHRAVAELFIPNPENKPCVDHIDGNPWNNNVNNLRWVTNKENIWNENTHYKMLGHEPYNKGKKMDEEYCKARSGWKLSEEKRKLISERNKNRKATDETRKKQSESRKKYFANMSEAEYLEYCKRCSDTVWNKGKKGLQTSPNKGKHRVYDNKELNIYHYE